MPHVQRVPVPAAAWLCGESVAMAQWQAQVSPGPHLSCWQSLRKQCFTAWACAKGWAKFRSHIPLQQHLQSCSRLGEATRMPTCLQHLEPAPPGCTTQAAFLAVGSLAFAPDMEVLTLGWPGLSKCDIQKPSHANPVCERKGHSVPHSP